MTTQLGSQPSLFHKIATFFPGSSTRKASTKQSNAGAAQPEGTVVEVATPLVPLATFDDYAVDDDEPADLALVDLIPPGLSAFNLPHYEETQPLDAQIGPACLINACRLEDRPLTETEMEAAELEDLIPAELSKLNIARAKAAIAMKEERTTPQPLPDLATLQSARGTAVKKLQTAA
ncbi:MAG: hypothetical protein AAF810_16630 [Cyanobacteria bacterium P01_D01_bin.36]